MDIGIFPIALSLLTFGLVVAFAVTSRAQTKERMNNPNRRKSSLASDGDPHKAAN